jgi:hypothetical protein
MHDEQHARNAARYEAHVTRTYDVGDKVWVWQDQKTNKDGKSAKMKFPWVGPYMVTKQLTPVTYELANTKRTLPNIHVTNMAPVRYDARFTNEDTTQTDINHNDEAKQHEELQEQKVPDERTDTDPTRTQTASSTTLPEIQVGQVREGSLVLFREGEDVNLPYYLGVVTDDNYDEGLDGGRIVEIQYLNTYDVNKAPHQRTYRKVVIDDDDDKYIYTNRMRAAYTPYYGIQIPLPWIIYENTDDNDKKHFRKHATIPQSMLQFMNKNNISVSKWTPDDSEENTLFAMHIATRLHNPTIIIHVTH